MLGSQPPRKRQRTEQGFGAASEYDELTSQNTPSLRALSTRKVPLDRVPSLLQLAIHVFVVNLRDLYSKHTVMTQRLLKSLPMDVASRIFTLLREDSPAILGHAFLVPNFIRPPDVVLTGLMPVKPLTLHAIADLKGSLLRLEVSGVTDISDEVFAAAIRRLPNLESLILRGCKKVSSKTVAAAIICTRLKVLNLNGTSPTVASLVPLLRSNRELEVLKIAELPKASASAIASLLQEVCDVHTGAIPPFSKLKALKLRQTGVNNAVLSTWIQRTPLLERLDISYTAVTGLTFLGSPCSVPQLQKLSLSGTHLQNSDWIHAIDLAQLQILNAGSMGLSRGALTLTDTQLRMVTDLLEPLEHLESVNLVGNNQISMTSSRGNGAIAEFVSRVGWRCSRLNLGGISKLCSEDLRGLLREDETKSKLVSLTLSNTAIDDEAAVYLSTCPELQALALENTKITSEGVFTIIDGCPNLRSIDLTSCRGVPVTDRRRFFEVWKDTREEVKAPEDASSHGRRSRWTRP